MKLCKLCILFLIFCNFTLYPQKLDPDTVSARKYDMGKMWTFENPPVDYFRSEYNFTPSVDWFDYVRKSALRFGNGCSASFISEDGLIMTNHHCARNLIPKVQSGTEDFLRDGFFAKDLGEERRINGLFVDQLLVIEDVTAEIHNAMNKVQSDTQKLSIRQDKINQIIEREKGKDNSLIYRVTALYNGGKYSLYGYKRYNDIRLVFAPDLRTAKFGGDYDNFTYPRYGLDCTFLRAYENEKPVKTKYFFKWKTAGADPGEAVFVIGNPGGTDRLSTIAQMEYDRDIYYPMYVNMLRQQYSLQERIVKENGAKDFKLIARLYSIGNTLKVYEGTLKGLQDEYLMARKKDFENKFRAAVNNNPELKSKYSGIWDEIAASRKEAALFAKEIYALNISPSYSSKYFLTAEKLVNLFSDISKRGRIPYTNMQMDSILNEMYPDDLDSAYERELLKIQCDLIIENLGSNNPLVNKLFSGNKGYTAADYILQNSHFKTKKEFLTFARLPVEQVLSGGDPFVIFIVDTRERLDSLKKRNEELQARGTINNQMLGEALFAIYGDEIPPDATGTLRIADGVLESYNYNGTIAPIFTTFYGVLDRYYGFNREFPYNLPPVWENLPKEFDLSTKLDFICTNDIIGGNSGSPLINKNAEIVGLVFDGNIESMPGNYIYTTEANRTICVHPAGMIEGIRDLYKAYRISDEILYGKLKK